MPGRLSFHPGKTGRFLVLIAVAAYALRFLSSWAVLAYASDRRFDPHGFGLLGDVAELLFLLLPLLVLLVLVVRRDRRWAGLLAPGRTRAATVSSVVLAALIGAPTLGQAWALRLLSPADSWPVLASVVFWLAVVAVLRAWAVSPAVPAPAAVR